MPGCSTGAFSLFTLGCAVLTGILFGIVPAWQISKADLNSTLKESSSRSGTGRHHYARSALVVAETALALVLLIGAALLIRTFASLRGVNAGFNPSHVLSFETSLGGSKYATTAASDRLTRDLVRRIESVPGRDRRGERPLPAARGRLRPRLRRSSAGRCRRASSPPAAPAGCTSPSPISRCSRFRSGAAGCSTSATCRASPSVVVINESFAKKYWPKDDPIGQQIEIGKGMGPDFAEAPRQIVGIVGDVKEAGLGSPAPEVMYIPLAQTKDSFMALNNTIIPMTWVVKTTVQPLTLMSAVRKEVLAVDSQLALAHERSLEQVFAESMASQSFNMTLLCVFAGIALLLAAIGIYGTLSYSVEQRSQEIGIRMALGAQAADVRAMVVRQGMGLAGLGIVIGLAGALGLSRLLTTLLFGVQPNDPLTFAAIGGAIALVALVACWLPARRATRVDPLVALRYE